MSKNNNTFWEEVTFTALHVPDCLSVAWDERSVFQTHDVFIQQDDGYVVFATSVGHQVFLFTSSEFNIAHFVSVSGRLRDRRARQSYKVKYLGLAVALQVSVIILLQAFLLCWIIMEVRVYACHLSSVGGGSQRASQSREMCTSLLCHRDQVKLVMFLQLKLKQHWLHCFYSAADVKMKHVLRINAFLD